MHKHAHETPFLRKLNFLNIIQGTAHLDPLLSAGCSVKCSFGHFSAGFDHFDRFFLFKCRFMCLSANFGPKCWFGGLKCLELWAVWAWEYDEPGRPNEPRPLASPEKQFCSRTSSVLLL